MSTMDAEIIALTHCCCKLFPVVDQVKELRAAVGLPTHKLATIKVSIHEDNSGALILAQTIPPQFTPRSKLCNKKSLVLRRDTKEKS